MASFSQFSIPNFKEIENWELNWRPAAASVKF